MVIKKAKYFIPFYTFVILLFSDCSNTRKIRVYYELDFTSWEGMNQELPVVKYGDNSTINLFEIKFYNNPYKLDTSNKICLLFNSRPVYSGPFFSKVQIAIPIKWLESGKITIRPGIIIEKNGNFCVIEKTYNDLTWEINSNSCGSLGIIFLPEMSTLEDRFSVVDW